MTDRPCPACGPGSSGTSVFLWQKDGYRIDRCTSCGLGYVVDPPDGPHLATLYQESYFEDEGSAGYSGYGQSEERKRRHFRTLLDRMQALHPTAPPGALLEVGSAYGFFLDEAAGRGWDVTGVELSTFAAEEARLRFGFSVLDSLEAMDALERDTLDAVVAWDVIEHLAEPERFLRRSLALLRPGGLLALSTGDFASTAARLHGRHWSLMTPPWHLWFFTRKSIRRLLTNVGFRVAAVDGDGTVLVDAAATSPILPRWAESLMSRPPLTRVFRRLGMGQIMMVYARKP